MKLGTRIMVFLLKGILGLGAIYLTNLGLAQWDIAIGLNACNGIIIGILGISGFVLLYVLAFADYFVY